MKRVFTLAALLLVACGGNPPPQPPQCPTPPPPGDPVVIWRGDTQVDITWDDMPVVVCEGEDIQARILQRQHVLQLPEPMTPVAADSFCGFDRGDVVEADVSLYDDQNRVLYRRSLHLEGGVPECYDAFEPRPSLSTLPTSRVTIVVTCRANGANEVTGSLSARCHLQGTVIFEEDNGPPPPQECVPPGEPPDPWGDPVPPSTRSPQMSKALQAAKIVVGDRCGEDPSETLRLLAAALQEAGHCAAGPWGKEAGQGAELAIRAPDLWHGDPLYEQFHPVAWTDGCYTLGGKYIAAWPYTGDPNTCGPPIPPPLSRAKVKLHQVQPKRTYDWAFLVRGTEYCAHWWTDGRLYCTVRPDGHPEKEACEDFRVGTPVWTHTKGTCWVRPNLMYRCDDDAVGGFVTVCDGRTGAICASQLVE